MKTTTTSTSQAQHHAVALRRRGRACSARSGPADSGQHSWRAALYRVFFAGAAVLVSTGLLTLHAASAANAGVVTSTAGDQVGAVSNFGSALCKPMRFGDVSNHYIEMHGPFVDATPYYSQAGTSTVGGYGGGQEIWWAPMLQKYQRLSNGTYGWVTVWAPGWYKRNPITQDFPAPWVNVYALTDRYGRAIGGTGYYRLTGTISWAADAHHYAGAETYRLTRGDYFAEAWGNLGASGSTSLNTDYCWIG